MKKDRILVIVPAYNEAEIIAQTVENIRQKATGADILVINDGSLDKTAQELERIGVPHLNLRMNLGIGGAVQTGYRCALAHDYDYAVRIDGDGQHDPAYILPMIEWMKKEGVDLGIGSRFLTREGFQSGRARRAGIRFLSFLIRLICGADIKDVTSGYRIVNRKLIELYAQEYSDDYPESDSIPAAVFHGCKVAEYPVMMNERVTGKSSIGAGKSVYYMIKVSISVVLYRMMHGAGER